MQHHRQDDRLDRLRALPKAEVHVHLEGCFEAAMLQRWADEAGASMPRPAEELFQFERSEERRVGKEC